MSNWTENARGVDKISLFHKNNAFSKTQQWNKYAKIIIYFIRYLGVTVSQLHPANFTVVTY